MKVFIEEQKFSQPFLLIGLSVVFILVSITTFQNWEVINQESLSSKIGSLSGILIILSVTLLFIFLKLKSRIDEMGIHLN